MGIKRLVLLVVLSALLVLAIQIGCDKLVTERIYITEAGHPIADFGLDSNSTDIGCAPHTVTFVDLSDGPRDQWTWYFGDGDSSHDTTPTHTYDTGGVYTVTLKIYDSETDGQDTEVEARYIMVGATSAQFVADPDSVCAGMEVIFTPVDYGLGKEWVWDFGDGDSSTDSNPTHAYDSVGVYHVTLTVTDTCGEKSYTDSVQTTDCPVILFAADPRVGVYPLTVQFYDSSVARSGQIISRVWKFGTYATSNVRDPIYEYDNPGNYTVSLTVVTTEGESTDSAANFIIVYDSLNAIFSTGAEPVACYSQYQQFQVKFVNESTGQIDSVRWYFGDGTTSDEMDPVHAYTIPGIYDVSLVVHGLLGLDSTAAADLVWLSDTLLPENVSFSVSLDSGSIIDTFTVTGTVTSGVVRSQTWYVNGKTSTANPYNIVFDTAGIYPIRWVVSNSCGEIELFDTVRVTGTVATQ